MIARTWSGRTRRDHEEDYLKYVLETGIRDILEIKGNRGALLLRRLHGEEVELLLISLWGSIESIEAFTGPEVEKARYYPEDDKYLLEKPEKVIHYEVVYSSSAI